MPAAGRALKIISVQNFCRELLEGCRPVSRSIYETLKVSGIELQGSGEMEPQTGLDMEKLSNKLIVLVATQD